MRGRGAIRRERLRRAAGLARKLNLGETRAERFSRRLAGEAVDQTPTLEDLRDWPEWPGCEARAQVLVFSMTALVAGGAALREEISGAVLRQIAARTGDDLLEQALTAREAGGLPLPDPEALEAAGRALAIAALPRRLAQRLGYASAQHDNGAARYVAEAERLVDPASFREAAA